jgi:hypothetical protein
VNRHERVVALAPAAAKAALAGAARDWGAEWSPAGDGGRLVLPVVFGLRRGFATGTVAVEPAEGGSRLVWTLEESRLAVHRSSVVVLSLAAVPALGALAWPFFPPLLALAPLGAVLGFLAWWLVVARLRSSGPEDFLALVGEAAEGGDREPAVLD